MNVQMQELIELGKVQTIRMQALRHTHTLRMSLVLHYSPASAANIRDKGHMV